MALAITAVRHPETARVTLTVTGAGAGSLSITRVDRNGTRPVRLGYNQLPVAGTLTVDDYECALVGDLDYSVVDSIAATATVHVLSLDTGTPWLGHPGLPALNLAVTIEYDQNISYPGRSTRHDVYGRPDPVFTVAPQGWRTGVLRLLAADYPTAQRIKAVHDSGQPALLRQPCLSPDEDGYHVADTVALAPIVESQWQGQWHVDVTYTRVGLPVGPLQGSLVWTYANVRDTYATYATLPSTYATYAALAAGPTG